MGELENKHDISCGAEETQNPVKKNRMKKTEFDKIMKIKQNILLNLFKKTGIGCYGTNAFLP